MQEILDLNRPGQSTVVVTSLAQGSKLASADMHGAEMQVVRSRCAGRVGIRGVVVRDTKFTFVIVMPNDRVVTVPKEYTVFRFMVPFPSSGGEDVDGDGVKDAKDNATGERENPKELVFELHGSQFQNRAVDRANKKFKWKNVDYV